MAQRDKVKELVGRGLNSYHTKALQQMDRIEKKNKEQNHKISILSNELDNDYLTKTEEGSVISLEHSKEGMVYLDELQGNTLVNYCTDGSKEMTLNGDIDVEGVSVTTTEGVDNGKVDMMCEGNTLVNLFNRATLKIQEKSNRLQCDNLENRNMYKASKYTFVNLSNKMVQPNMYTKSPYVWQKSYRVAPNSKMVIELLDNQELTEVVWNYSDGWTENDISYAGNTFLILEGDWTNKEVPQSYFEGMKSVGQNDENGHKIEILSRNKNMIQGLPRTVAQDVVSHDIYLEPNKTYSISTNVPFHEGLGMIGKNHNHTNPIITFQNWGENVKRFSTPNNFTKGIYSLIFWKSGLATDETSWTQVEIGTTTTEYTLGAINKKEILMREPLRGISDEIRDKFIKRGTKWYIERNCGEIIFDGKQTITGVSNLTASSDYCKFGYALNNCKDNSLLICNKLPYKVDKAGVNADMGEHISSTNNNWKIIFQVKKTNNVPSSQQEVSNYLANNPMTVIYQLTSPIYEEITDIELLTYLDVTHISNNSIIPCNMKVKNSGYNAIIKPSTQYTVALDTDKAGTIGMNLGGAKGTTTNNVLTLTTPATLTDDSLRIYGKGIKGSKVRLLEGDKTNWMPSYFEGMKSSFEDKVQDDGSYKMEILSNNGNLITKNEVLTPSSGSYDSNKIKTEELENGVKYTILNTTIGCYSSTNKKIRVKPNTTYTLIIDVDDSNYTKGHGSYFEIFSQDSKNSIMLNSVVGSVRTKYINNKWVISFRTLSTTQFISFTYYIGGKHGNGVYNIGDIIIYTNPIMVEGDYYNNGHKYMLRNYNKIQFSSIEPLRGVGDIKDKFVFKDNKLMIERNCQVTILDGNNELWTYEQMYGSIYNNKMLFLIKDKTTSNFNPNTNGDYHSDRLNRTNGLTEYYNEGFILREDKAIGLVIESHRFNNVYTTIKLREWLSENPLKIVYQLTEPTYEEIPFELQKIILEGYENATLFFDTNIPPTSTVTYAGETPIVKSVKLNKTEVLNNTEDINDNIIPYLMDMDYRVVMLQLATEKLEGGVSMARLFGGTYEMIKRDILSKRLSRQEYGYRLADYFNAGKLTEQEVRELEDLR